MKLVAIANEDAKKLLETIVTNAAAGSGGIQFAEMEKRLRVKAVLKDATPDTGLLLEDADYAMLREVALAFPFGAATQDIFDTLKAIKDAKEAPKPKKVEKTV